MRYFKRGKYIFVAFICLIVAGSLKAITYRAIAQIVTPPAAVKVPILIYHSIRPYYPGITNTVKDFTVPPQIFEEQLQYLKNNGYTAVSVNALVSYFNLNRPLPPKPVIITFDDGWENQYRYALPLLKKYGDTAIFYIYSNAIDHKHFLSWNQVRSLDISGMVVAGHTKSHPELPKITDQGILQEEIITSKHVIESQIGKVIDSFAYPFGEYNDQDVALVKSGGYLTARGVKKGIYHAREDLFTLNGIIVTGNFNRFVAALNLPLQKVGATAAAISAATSTSDILQEISPSADTAFLNDAMLMPDVAQATATMTTPTRSSVSSTATSTAPSLPVPLLISNIGTVNIVNNSAHIVWTTNLAANSQVNYSTNHSMTTGVKMVTDNHLVTSHDVALSGLSSGATYYFTIVSKDASSTTAMSGVQSFTTKK